MSITTSVIKHACVVLALIVIIQFTDHKAIYTYLAGVFYCGAPALTKELRQLASDFSHKTSTKFEFHKENF